jgi:hypothetical protein
LEELQAKMLSALTRQATSAGTAAALNGPVGDAIARLELGSAGRQLDEINARLQALQTQVGEVRNDTAAIRQDMQGLQASLKGVAREVSDDPRKELVKRGYSVDRRGLEKAMLQKDLVALAHFNASGYVPRYREFVGFLFHEGWDPLVFNALSPQMLGLPGSCSEWAIYHSMGFEIDKLKLQHEVRLCGREPFISKLRNFLEVKTSDSQSYPYDWAEEKEKLEQLRKTINPKKKQPVIAAGSTMYLDECTFNRFCEQGITPQDFAVREKSYLDGVAAWEASKKQWRAEVERTIELVKKM